MQRYEVPVSKDVVDQVMAAADGAVVKLLQTIYDYVHEDPAAQSQQQIEYQEQQYYDPNAALGHSLGSPIMQHQQQPVAFAAVASPEYMLPGSLPYMQQPYAGSPSAAYQLQQQPPGTSYPPQAAYPSPGLLQQAAGGSWTQQYPVGVQYPTSAPMQQQQQQAGQYPQQMYSTGMAVQMQAAGSSAMPQQVMGNAVQHASAHHPVTFAADQGQPGANMPSIEYDRRPRAVDYKPYTQQDYSSRNYDAKTQKEYWKLGTLGPQIEDEDLQVAAQLQIVRPGDVMLSRSVTKLA